MKFSPARLSTRLSPRLSARICLLLAFATLLASTTRAAEPLRIFAAASLTDALGELSRAYEQAHPGTRVQSSFAGSSTLAKQLQQGARADLFISADRDWLDFLQQQNLLDDPSRRDLLGNQLVLIAPRDQPVNVDLAQADRFWASFNGRLCVGATASVPAGKYARQSLEALGWWPQLQPHLVETEDVRAALALVARGECALGIVYQTDATLSEQVIQVAPLPASSHKAIVYPGALLKQHQAQAESFWQFLQSPAAATVFRKYGFDPLPTPATAASEPR